MSDTEPEGRAYKANSADRDHFLALCWDYMVEVHGQGCSILPTDHNLRLYRELFDDYTRGTLPGVCAFWQPQLGHDPVGFVLVGAERSTSVWDTEQPPNGGKRATLWGVYIRPTHRTARAGFLVELSCEETLKAQGFTEVSTAVNSGNKMGEGNWRHWHEARNVRVDHTVIVAQIGPKES